MRENVNKNTNQKNPGGRTDKTQYMVSTPNEYESNGEKKTFWTNIGRAFETDKGIIVHLNALPVSAKLYLQVPENRDS